MGGYKIYFKDSVQKDFRVIPDHNLKKSLQRIKLLGKDQRPLGCEKLTGQERYRVRQGLYRIVYSIQDNELTIWIVKVSHHKDIYR